MTRVRAHGSVDAVLFDAVRKLSDDELDAYTGKSRDHFQKVTRQSNLGLWFADAAKLDAALLDRGEAPVFIDLFIAIRDGARRDDQPPADPEAMRELAERLLPELHRLVSQKPPGAPDEESGS